MSWDGYARRAKEAVIGGQPQTYLAHLEDDDPALPAFEQASKDVEAKGHGVEAWLREGSLTSRSSARLLERAVGTFPSGDWYPEKVRELAAKADWSFEVSPQEMCNKLTAQAFLEVCAKHGLGIQGD